MEHLWWFNYIDLLLARLLALPSNHIMTHFKKKIGPFFSGIVEEMLTPSSQANPVRHEPPPQGQEPAPTGNVGEDPPEARSPLRSDGRLEEDEGGDEGLSTDAFSSGMGRTV